MNYPGLLLNGSSSAICFDLCLTHGPVRLHHAIFLNITQPKGTNLKIYPMHEFKTLNSKTWDESRVMIVLNIKNWNENRVVQLEENWTLGWKQGNFEPRNLGMKTFLPYVGPVPLLFINIFPTSEPGKNPINIPDFYLIVLS